MGHPHLLLRSTVLVRCIVGVARAFVVAIDSAHLVVPVLYLPDQLAAEVVQIQVHISRTVAGQQDVAVGYLDAAHGFLPDVFLRLFLYHLLHLSRGGIAHVDAQAVLMAVHRIDSHLFGIAGHDDAGDIAVLVQWHLQLLRLLGGYVIAPHRHRSVLLAGYRIFISIESRIVGKLLLFGFQSFEQQHRVLLHRSLVVANPHHMAAVCREHHGTVVAELLLVYPVGYAVNHLVAPAVRSHLNLLGSIQVAYQKDVIVSHKGYARSVRREERRLLVTICRQGSQPMVCHAVDIVSCRVRMAVDAPRMGLNQHIPTVRTHLIAVYALYLATLYIVHVQQRPNLFARLERAHLNTPSALSHTGITLPVGQRAHTTHRGSSEVATRQILQLQFLTGTYCG